MTYSALFTGLPKQSSEKFQFIQNCAARSLTKTRKIEHIAPVLAKHHWLPVSFGIDLKVLYLFLKPFNGLGRCIILHKLIDLLLRIS